MFLRSIFLVHCFKSLLRRSNYHQGRTFLLENHKNAVTSLSFIQKWHSKEMISNLKQERLSTVSGTENVIKTQNAHFIFGNQICIVFCNKFLIIIFWNLLKALKTQSETICHRIIEFSIKLKIRLQKSWGVRKDLK